MGGYGEGGERETGGDGAIIHSKLLISASSSTFLRFLLNATTTGSSLPEFHHTWLCPDMDGRVVNACKGPVSRNAILYLPVISPLYHCFSEIPFHLNLIQRQVAPRTPKSNAAINLFAKRPLDQPFHLVDPPCHENHLPPFQNCLIILFTAF